MKIAFVLFFIPYACYAYNHNSNDEVWHIAMEEAMNGNNSIFISLIIYGFIITFIVGNIPALISRYIIFKKPLEYKHAKKLSVIFSITGFIIFLLLGGGNPLAWYINYHISRWVMHRRYDVNIEKI